MTEETFEYLQEEQEDYLLSLENVDFDYFQLNE